MPIFGKTLRVLGHAELFEPVRNLLHRGHDFLACASGSAAPRETVSWRAKRFLPSLLAIAERGNRTKLSQCIN